MSSSAWVICFVSIRFDLDIGPVIDHVVPSDALSDEGKRILTQTAFPDCNPESGHDLIFFFHMKDVTAAAARSQAETVVAPCRKQTVSYIHGATYYRQKRDPSVPRGYVQQAFVLLSRLPYMAVHELILRVVVPRLCQCCELSPDMDKVPVLSALSPIPTTFFEVDSSFNPSQYSQKEVLERAIEEIEGWPSPHPHVQYNVTLLYQPLTFVTPKRCLQKIDAEISPVNRHAMHLDDRVAFLGSKHQSVGARDVIPLYALLSELLRHLTQIWELLLCHESIFIWSNTPSMASAVAVAVASLVQPLEYNGILRSYFTVQDEIFNRFSRMGKGIPFSTTESIIVAGTNPFFFRAFDGWHNILTVVDRQARSTGGAITVEEKGNNGNECTDANTGNGMNPITITTTTTTTTTSSTTSSSTATTPVRRGEGSGSGSNNNNNNNHHHHSVSPKGIPLVNEHMTPPESPRVFTYRNFFPVLTAARQNTSFLPIMSGGGTGDKCFNHHKVVNMFKSTYPFLVDHKAQTAILLHRLEQASRLNAEAQLASLNAHVWNGISHLEECTNSSDVTDCTDRINTESDSAHIFSQYSIADDIVRKFFVTLTKEFIKPVNAWFQAMTSPLTVFHLCDPATVCALTSDSFLNFLKENRESVPSFLSCHPYKTYSVMYERFAKGSLFHSVVWQLVETNIRQGLEEMQVDVWAREYPSEAERIDMFINLYKLVQREVTHSIDPDVVFVTMAISVLAEMVAYVSEPLRDQFMLKIRELKI
ncbi:uncharacterized protein TM35_000022850 [Trypanosoma theileri]|uniref:UDENN domain-containing protein n=1 Tax=Trypanosoma theileri TaxID=67003 RepID=A0A1X0P8Q1_9TRYP|nr:uncharacterized protein TM35_000022850 [Trypanosoma theileri]ORC92959.1 hypothetical protein TM35_000022850 [Trypanosoma theileri]